MPADPNVYIKTHASSDAATQAAAHHRWLTRIGAPVPDLLAIHGRHLHLRQVTGRHVGHHDLPTAAHLLGTLHAAAYRRELHTASGGTDFPTGDELTIPAFTSHRRVAAIHAALAGRVPEPAFDAHEADRVLNRHARAPMVFYKDSNIRNLLITPDGPVVIDLDDLTLAPVGYDLAKLLISAAMTYGATVIPVFGSALRAYNDALEPAALTCPSSELHTWIEMHHLLTARYSGRHGYTTGWQHLRSRLSMNESP